MFYHQCAVCETIDPGFTPLASWFSNNLTKYGFPYKLSDFETLNFRTYACGNCGAYDKERLFALYIKKNLSKSKSINFVDFAPAKPLQGYLHTLKNLNYRSADLYMEGVDDKIDITDMKIYKSNSVDFFICSHVLEHVLDDIKALRELRRILSPGGTGIIMTPIIDKPGVFDEDVSVTEPAERWHRFAQDDHVRLYEKAVFIERVRKAGLLVEEFGVQRLGLRSFIQNAIDFKSRIYIVKKDA